MKRSLRKLIWACLFAVHLAPVPAVAIQEDNIQLLTTGGIDPNSFSYLYAGSVMYDPVEAKFKYWGCGGVAGDYIIYKEASVFEDLQTAAWQTAMTPTGVSGTFDSFQVCDPSVVEHNGVFYLHYTGINYDTDPIHTSKIGVAVSYNRGRTFSRLFSGQPIKGPAYTNLYGVGQSSVVRGPDGMFYMLYSDINYDTDIWTINFVRSPVPSFPQSLQETLVSFPAWMFGGVSLELAYNRGRGLFEILVNWTDGQDLTKAQVRVVHLDESFMIVGDTIYSANTGFAFGEGIATVTNPLGEIIPFVVSGQNHFNFVATTFGNRPPFADWVTGPVKYARFTEGPNGVITNFSDVGDKSFSGDLDGDGQTDRIVMAPSTFTWKYKLSSEGFSVTHTLQWGLSGDIPIVVKDWNQDGDDEIAVYRPSEGKWYIHYSGTTWPNVTYDVVQWGFSGDFVFSGDTNGDGDTELIVWRPSTGVWHILYSGSWPNVVSSSVQYGLNGDAPFLYDVNNNGEDDFIAWRLSNSNAYVFFN